MFTIASLAKALIFSKSGGGSGGFCITTWTGVSVFFATIVTFGLLASVPTSPELVGLGVVVAFTTSFLGVFKWPRILVSSVKFSGTIGVSDENKTIANIAKKTKRIFCMKELYQTLG